MSMRTTRRFKASRPSVRGFSLLEVLLSLSILAFGLLGMTALQNEALKFNQAAFLDSQAQFLLNDMVERIRANRGSSLYLINFTEVPAAVAVNCTTTSCSSNQMALWDVKEWRDNVENPAFLPAGKGQIEFDVLTQVYVISIRYEWRQLNDPDTTTRTLTMTTRI
ncbi:MAG: type IV pilus modification protein PilV [Pseudomonadales bacterium]|nr:type IV pilus modification protein PilV [Pseudomonadales bacterium]